MESVGFDQERSYGKWLAMKVLYPGQEPHTDWPRNQILVAISTSIRVTWWEASSQRTPGHGKVYADSKAYSHAPEANLPLSRCYHHKLLFRIREPGWTRSWRQVRDNEHDSTYQCRRCPSPFFFPFSTWPADHPPSLIPACPRCPGAAVLT